MRFSSLSSISSDISDDGDQSFLDFISSPFSQSSDYRSPRQTKNDPSQSAPLPRNFWMIDFNDGWMQPEGFDFQFEATDDHLSAATSDPGQLYGESVFAPPYSSNFPQQTPQPSVGSHRRLPSSSSIASAAESPFPHHPSLPLQPYPTTYVQPTGLAGPQLPPWACESHSPLSSVQHLPTPTGTPNPDPHSPNNQSHSRRTKPAANQQAALAAAHNSVRLALNQQWKPRTCTQTNTQSQNLLFADMPRTPVTVNGEEPDGQQFGPVPKFNRTVSDAQADELYNPSTYGQASSISLRPHPQQAAYLQPQQAMLQERLTAANEARSSSPSSPSRHASPFRKSPYLTDSSAYNQSGMAGPMPDADMSGSNTAAFQQQAQHEDDSRESKTVSPKDTFPEQPVPKDETFSSLFPTESTQPVQYAPHNAPTSDLSAFTSLGGQNWSFQATSIPSNLNSLDVKHEGLPQGQLYGPVYSSSSGHGNYLPPNLASMETTKSDESEETESTPEIPTERPSDTSASSSRYTCPYKNEATGWQCNERFDDPMQLNKHKKEAHRPSGSQADKKTSKMSQAGPHKCTRINPSTGKPCDTVFSRPYDLTRHEDTIHGERKKTRCPYCTEEKLFSRGDALTRHLRVVHSSMPQNPGKQRGRRSLG